MPLVVQRSLCFTLEELTQIYEEPATEAGRGSERLHGLFYLV